MKELMKISGEVLQALAEDKPVVALESTVIAHGLPYPDNIETARRLESAVRASGAVPATIAVFGGEFCVGLEDSQLEKLATSKNIRKIARRDLPIALARGLDCATTVSTTAYIAHRAGIKVFATGGIGGVHRGYAADVSADLPELASTPITVVCSGAKIVLDLPATREWLETHGVTILGWKCDEMPAFYSSRSGLFVDQRIENAAEAASIAHARDLLGLPGAVLVTAPVPTEHEVNAEELERILKQALELAQDHKITGKEITPFLLAEMSRGSNGQTLAANTALLENNARIAGEIAAAICS